jgi:hypothetical protein
MQNHASRDSVQMALVNTFAPMHKRALGMAVGLVAGVGIFVLTAFHIVVASPAEANVELLSHYFYGYRLDWLGGLIGAWWGGVAGFVAGWFFAFVRNFVVLTWLLVIKTKADLFQTRDFLDHI